MENSGDSVMTSFSLKQRVGLRAGFISLFPQDRAYTRALKSEMSLSSPIPVGGRGAWIQMTGKLQYTQPVLRMVQIT